MGIKREIQKIQLPKKYHKYDLIETVDGVADTVYLLGKDYVLKLFEQIDEKQLINEQVLLRRLSRLNVPKIDKKFLIDDKWAVVYTQIKGESRKKVTQNEIIAVGEFLKNFHKKTKSLKSLNKNLFEPWRLKELIKVTKNSILLDYIKYADLEFKNNGIIHGDLFLDNAKFYNKKIGVFDFVEACEGDFLLDLAVVASSWCFDNKEKLDIELLNLLLYIYDEKIEKKNFFKYIKYALLHYATRRFVEKRNYLQLTKRIFSLNLIEAKVKYKENKK